MSFPVNLRWMKVVKSQSGLRTLRGPLLRHLRLEQAPPLPPSLPPAGARCAGFIHPFIKASCSHGDNLSKGSVGGRTDSFRANLVPEPSPPPPLPLHRLPNPLTPPPPPPPHRPAQRKHVHAPPHHPPPPHKEHQPQSNQEFCPERLMSSRQPPAGLTSPLCFFPLLRFLQDRKPPW